ncbi:MAG: anaerobic sulfite reductase subunit A, partial [bacterium]
MGYVLNQDGFTRVLRKIGEDRRIYAPVNKVGEGRFTDVDVVRYDFVEEACEIELEKKSDYAFKELLTPLSQTLFFFTENEVKEADFDQREVIIFLRSCDLHAVKRLDAIYLENKFADPFYKRIRDR